MALKSLKEAKMANRKLRDEIQAQKVQKYRFESEKTKTESQMAKM